MLKLYVSKNGILRFNKEAFDALGVVFGNDSYVGIIEDFAENSFYLYGSTPTSEKLKRKVRYDKANNTYYISIKPSMAEKLFLFTNDTYMQMALEEEPYEKNGIECYKIISQENLAN